jgi:hypothetical protein
MSGPGAHDAERSLEEEEGPQAQWECVANARATTAIVMLCQEERAGLIGLAKAEGSEGV